MLKYPLSESLARRIITSIARLLHSHLMKLGPDGLTPRIVFKCYKFRVESDCVHQPISDFILHRSGTIRQNLEDMLGILSYEFGIRRLLHYFLLVLVELLATIHHKFQFLPHLLSQMLPVFCKKELLH